MRKSQSTDKVETLKAELTKIRHESLLATRQNDFRRMAQLTMEAARLNKVLRETAFIE
jgi:hypothetical protein